MERLQMWLGEMLQNLEATEDQSGLKLVMRCGRACANNHSVPQKAAALRQAIHDPHDLDQVLKAVNEQLFGVDLFRREGDLIYGTYPQCYCPIRRDGLVNSRFFCNCTRGWAQAVFEAILDRPAVDVELRKAIAWGDEVCQFVVRV